MSAAPAQQQKAQARVTLHGIDGQDQLANHLRIERVVLFRAVQPERGEAAWVMQQFEGMKGSHEGLQGHMRNRPKVVGSMGAFNAAARARARMSRVCAGSMTPSSHSRALE
jgi:phage shock protein A